MADKDFDFDNLLSGSNTSNTGTTSTTSNTDVETKTASYPFSVRLDARYVEVIKALAWYKRISQREFLEQAIDSQLAEIDSQELNEALNKFRNEQSS